MGHDVRYHRVELVVEPAAHAILGTRMVTALATIEGPKGTVLYSSTVLEQAVVSDLLERPDGCRRDGPVDPAKDAVRS